MRKNPWTVLPVGSVILHLGLLRNCKYYNVADRSELKGKPEKSDDQPKLVKEFVIPGAIRLIKLARSYGLKVFFHSCGSIVDAIPLLIEAGADIIHPIQALAAGMQPENLKARFGGQIAFCGGVDTQELLPHGTQQDVMDKVKELRTIFPTGLIVSPSHEALQADVPPENVKAMFDEATKIY